MSIKQVKRLINGKIKRVFIFDFRLDGRRVRTPRDSYFPTRSECEEAVDAIMTDHRRGIYNFPADDVGITLKEIFDHWLAHLDQESRHPSTIARAKRCLKLFYEVLPASTRVDQVEDRHLKEFARRREAAGIKRSTIWTNLIPIIAALRFATEEIDSLRGWKPPKNPIRKPKGRRTRIITEEEESAILAELRRPLEWPENTRGPIREMLADIFELALLTGMRQGEILTLKWSEVHLDRSPVYRHGWIVVKATKTGDRAAGETDDRIVPLSSRAREIFDRRFPTRSCAYVFPSFWRKSRGAPAKDILLGFNNACERAGVPFGRDNGIVFHDTRRTAITRMLQAGIDIRTVMDIVGHKEIDTTMLVYAGSTPRSRIAAVEALDARVHFESTLGGKKGNRGQSGAKRRKP